MKTFQKKSQKKLLIYFVGAVIFFIAFQETGYWIKRKNLPEHKAVVTQKVIQKKQKQLNSWLHKSIDFLKDNDDYFETFPLSFYQELDEEGVALFFYRNDSIVFWSNFVIPVSPTYRREDFSKPCIRLSNGFYLSETLSHKNVKVVALSLVKNIYESNQTLLPDAFAKDIDLPAFAKVVTKHTKHPIYDAKNRYLFSLDNLEGIQIPTSEGTLLGFLFCFFVLLTFAFLKTAIWIVFKKQLTAFKLAILSPFYGAFFYAFLFLKMPPIIHNLQSFSYLFHHSTGPFSLGALLIVLIILLQYFYYLAFPDGNEISTLPIRKYNFSMAFWWSIFANIAVFTYLYYVAYLVKNTDAGEMFLDILKYNYYSILLLIAISILTVITAIVLWRSTDMVDAYIQRKHFVRVVTFSLIPFLALFFYNHKFTFLGIFVLVSFYASYYFFRKVNKGIISIGQIFTIVIIFNIGAGTQMMWSYEAKEKDIWRLVLKTLSIESDPTAEVLFTQNFDKISQDTALSRMVRINGDETEIRNYIKQTHLTNYWNQYYFSISLLTPKEVAEENIEKKYPSETSVSNLHFKNYNWEKFTYVGGPIMYKQNNGDTLFLFLFFDQNRKFKNIKVTDLLVKESAYKSYEDYTLYSFAKYNGRQLAQSYGDFPYQTYIKEVPKGDTAAPGYLFFSQDGYNHLAQINTEKGVHWIISHKKLPLFAKSNAYCMVFLVFCLTTIVFLLFNRKIFSGWKNSFKARLQTTLIVLIFASLVLMGIVSIIYISDMNSKKNDTFLKEKLGFLKKELSQEYERSDVDNPFILKKMVKDVNKYSKIYEMGINFFNLKGELLVTSSPEIIEVGIVSKYANPYALRILYQDIGDASIKGKIGKVDYLESFFTIRDQYKKPLYYVNIPTFSKPEESINELIVFIIAFINTYVLLIIVSVIILVLISNHITKPLKIIREQIGLISLKKKNRRIDWRSNDDLGKLVNEYNRMVSTLEENAYLLAQSERASGWQEMARQVAHEIKNPLTPMRLSVQQLLRTWNDKSPDFEDRLRKTSSLLIEQIDLLAAIASEFSDIAKLNSQKKEKVDLLYCLESAKDLAEVDTLNTIVEVKTHLHPFVYADKQQLIRAIVNLFKNSWEAAEGRLLMIKVEIKSVDSFFEIRVTDNGKGISDEAKKNIFKPYHTTKESGTGLGLTIVKGIVEGIGGSIDFISKESVGTTFIIRLPIYDSGQEEDE